VRKDYPVLVKISARRVNISQQYHHRRQVMASAYFKRGGVKNEALAPVVEKKKVKLFYQQEQFVWVLKWTHIHLFGMSMIFIFMGAITIWLDVSSDVRTWLVVLPFIGVLVDILAMWLKAFVSPAFFWLHVPGGGLFTIVFAYVSLRALWEMWFTPNIT